MFAIERVVDFMSISYGDFFWTPSVTRFTISNSRFTSSLPRCALFSRASF